MLKLVDSHCHIQSAGLKLGEKHPRELWAKSSELTSKQMITDANMAGVTRFVCVGCDPVDSQLAVDFVQKNDGCWASVGIHPHEAQKYVEQANKLSKLAKLAGQTKVVAVGETGLDYFYEHSPRQAQKAILKFQIELAQKHKLPLIFHVRQAFDDFWPIFETHDNLRGVLHSFTDSMANMQRAVEHGLFIGVNGIATFTKDPAQLEVYKTIPLQNLLLETDAPFLTPTPYRGTINQPKHVRVVAEFLSELRNESLEQLAEATTANAHELFSWK